MNTSTAQTLAADIAKFDETFDEGTGEQIVNRANAILETNVTLTLTGGDLWYMQRALLAFAAAPFDPDNGMYSAAQHADNAAKAEATRIKMLCAMPIAMAYDFNSYD